MNKKVIMETLCVPGDVGENCCRIRVNGRRELCLENYRGISDYSDTCITVKLHRGGVCVEGERLNVAYYASNSMKITGNIQNIHYE